MTFKLGEIYVLDKILPKKYHDFLYNYMANAPKWSLSGLNDQTGYESFNDLDHLYSDVNSLLEKVEEDNQSVFPIFGCGDDDFLETSPIFFPILHYIHHYFNYSYSYIPLRIKANLQKQKCTIDPKKTCLPHVDMPDVKENNYTIIYYFNDSDGDTTIFNEQIFDAPIKNFSIKSTFSPKEGRCVLFPAKYFHAGRFPSLSKFRMVLNLNILINNFNYGK